MSCDDPIETANSIPVREPHELLVNFSKTVGTEMFPFFANFFLIFLFVCLFHTPQSTSLHSICACPGRCLLDAEKDMGVRFDASNVGGSGLSVGAIVGIA